MKIVKLTIDEESDLEGIDAVALVEEPAIELDFQAFTKYKFESFDDYPKAAKQAAIVGIQRNKDLGNKFIYALIKNKPLINTYVKMGFTEASSYSTEMIKHI